jgi:hypothetical protein
MIYETSMRVKKSKICNITIRGFQIICGKKHYYLDFHHFPFFIKATIPQIFDSWFGTDGIYWPSLGADLSFEGLDMPKKKMAICKINTHPYRLEDI